MGLFLADGRNRVSLVVVRGINQRLIRKLKQAAKDRVVLLTRIAILEIGAASAADEKRVSGEHAVRQAKAVGIIGVAGYEWGFGSVEICQVGSAGPWKWAIVAGPVRPEYSPFHVNFLLAVSYVAVNVPVPLLLFGGTSLLPLSSALKEIISASAGCVIARHAVSIKPDKPYRRIVNGVISSPFATR